MSGALVSKTLRRYQNPEIIQHIASQYALALLSPHARARADSLRQDISTLNAAIHSWQNHLASLDEVTPELSPKKESWDKISATLFPDQQANPQLSWWQKINSWTAAGAFAMALLLSITWYALSPVASSSLSYIAVLTNEQGQAQLVAATYGEDRTLVLDMAQLPKVEDEEELELWVISKSDSEARSLGTLPKGQTSLSQTLSEAHWRLIKDSDSLIISVEEIGGSAIGEPSEQILAKGICVRLSAWEQNS